MHFDLGLYRRIVALELAVDRLTVELSELKARPQSVTLGGNTTIGGAGNLDNSLMTKAGGWAFPWGNRIPQADPVHVVPSKDGTQVVAGPTMVQHADGQYQETTYVYVAGDNVSRETSKGPNGAGGPK